MTDGEDRGAPVTRRGVLAAVGGLSGALSMVAAGQQEELAGDLTTGGSMALSEAYNVAGSLWIGPDSKRSSVAPDSGRIFVAADTQVRYYGDGSSWTKMGVGSSEEPVPSVNTEQVDTAEFYPSQWSGSDLGEQINNFVSSLDDRNEVHIHLSGKHTISTPVDLTNFRRVCIDGVGASLRIATAGDWGLDLTDSFDVYLQISEIFGDGTDTPQGAILSATSDSRPWADSGSIDRDDVNNAPEKKWFWVGAAWGYYNHAPLLHHARERTRISGDYTNNGSQGYATIVSPNNDFEINGDRVGATSPHRGSLNGSGGSASKTWIQRASFESRNQAGDGQLYLENPVDLTIRDVEFRSVGEPIVTVDATNGAADSLTFDRIRARLDGKRLGSISAPFMLVKTADGFARNITIRDINATLSDGGPAAPYIKIADDATNVLRNLRLEGYQNINDSTGIRAGPSQIEAPVIGTGPIDTLVANEQNRAITLDQDKATVANLTAKTTAGAGNEKDVIRAENGVNWQLISNVHIPESDRIGVYIPSGQNVRVENVVIEGTDDSPLISSGTRCVISNCRLSGTLDLRSGSQETVVVGTSFDTLADSGTRNVVNGVGRQSATPGSGNTDDDWGGFEGLAHRLGVVVEDQSVTPPYDQYRADSAGNWKQIG